MTTLQTEAEVIHSPKAAIAQATTNCTGVMIFSEIAGSLSTKPLRRPKTATEDDASDLKAIARAKKKGGYIPFSEVLANLGID